MRFFNRNIATPGMIGLEVVCAVSLSSAIVGLIKSKDLKYIFHIEGTSTTGKTTSLMLATSMWSTPEISPNGVSKTWNTTDNKLINSAGGNNGIMIGLDELSMINANCNQLTYLLTSENDKLRMTDNTATEFRTIFISTGEIQFKSTNFGGIAVRLFEVKGYNFTEDKETADKIIAFIKENYGSIGFKFARKLTKKSEKDILFRLDTITKTVIDKIRYHANKRGKERINMRAMLVDENKNLIWSEVENQVIKDDEVLVKICAAALNRADLLQRQGKYPSPAGCPEWMGLEIAGIIVEIGKDVTDWKVATKFARF